MDEALHCFVDILNKDGCTIKLIVKSTIKIYSEEYHFVSFYYRKDGSFYVQQNSSKINLLENLTYERVKMWSPGNISSIEIINQ